MKSKNHESESSNQSVAVVWLQWIALGMMLVIAVMRCVIVFAPHVIFDVDPTFANTEEWWLSIPEELRPSKEQPFYHLFAENETSYYVAYVSEQNLLPDLTGEPVEHPDVPDYFSDLEGDHYTVPPEQHH